MYPRGDYKVIRRFSTVRGVGPLTPVLFKGQLCLLRAHWKS